MARQIDALFSRLHNHSHHQNKYSHWERNPEFRESESERGGIGIVYTYPKQITEGRVSRVDCVAVLVYHHYHPPTVIYKHGGE